MSSAHVVSVSLRANPPLLHPWVIRRYARCPVGRHDGRVLIHKAAEWPAGARVLGRRPVCVKEETSKNETTYYIKTVSILLQLGTSNFKVMGLIPRIPGNTYTSNAKSL